MPLGKPLFPTAPRGEVFLYNKEMLWGVLPTAGMANSRLEAPLCGASQAGTEGVTDPL